MFERSYSKILFSTLCITHHAYAKKKKIKISHSHIHLLCKLILTLFILTHCEKQHEIFAACIINVWSFTDVLPKIKTTTTTKNNLVPKTTSLFLTKLHTLVTEKVAWHLSYICFISTYQEYVHRKFLLSPSSVFLTS